MPLLVQALQFLIGGAMDLLTLALLLRFYMNLVRAPFHHPLARLITALTDWAVMPLRRLLPGWRRIDWASLLLALLASLLGALLLAGLSGLPLARMPAALPLLLVLALVRLIRLFIYLIMGAVFIQAILFWVQPYQPLSALLDRLTDPWLRRARRLVGPIGGIDLSPMLVLIAGQLILMVPVAWLEQWLLSVA